jgi:hypothetical protein
MKNLQGTSLSGFRCPSLQQQLHSPTAHHTSVCYIQLPPSSQRCRDAPVHTANDGAHRKGALLIKVSVSISDSRLRSLFPQTSRSGSLSDLSPLQTLQSQGLKVPLRVSAWPDRDSVRSSFTGSQPVSDVLRPCLLTNPVSLGPQSARAVQ